ncbi:MAG: TPM domain-containing protein, partial [Lachnospiraceae bacterium]|nr:TPM domain-containing protein [Lachnospiraceae bacterium]
FEDFHYDAYTDAIVYLSVETDHLMNKIVTHRRIPKDSGNSGGGGSSTHTSSSGRSHGGGGRSF